MAASTAAVTAFREGYVTAGDLSQYDFASLAGRRARYALYAALYDASVYRSNAHAWSASFRQAYGLYKYIRQVEAPTQALLSFWQTHLFGGPLDMDAGDGAAVPSALPILTDNDALRVAIAQVWQWSNWAIKKDTFALQGAKLGDAALRVVDDRQRAKVYLQIVHPATIADLDLDPFGNVKGYTLEEERVHPETGKTVVYREEVTREGDDVVFATYAGDTAYAWPGNVNASGRAVAAWREPYGFVPLVWLNHIDIGGDFGLSELHQGLAVFRELDDIGSALDDQIRKVVNSGWLFSGVEDPKKSGRSDPQTTGASPSATRPEPGRQEVPILYGPQGAQATPLVAPLDIAGVNARIEALHGKLRRDYPELEADMATSAGDASGRALRVARQRAETKVNLRRATYDDALARAQMMAVAIGGFRGLDGFTGFSLDSYAAGALDHRIGPRPVFATSTMDEIEEDAAFWTAAQAAKNAGYPLELYLRDKGVSQERIDAYIQARDQAAERAREAFARQAPQGRPAQMQVVTPSDIQQRGTQ